MRNRRAIHGLVASTVAGIGLLSTGLVWSQAGADFGGQPDSRENYPVEYLAFNDLNGNGIHDDGEPLLSDSMLSAHGVGDSNWGSNPDNSPIADTTSVATDWPRLSTARFVGQTALTTLDEGPYAVTYIGGGVGDQGPNITGCAPGEIQLLVDGEPYDERLNDDPDYEATYLDGADEHPGFIGVFVGLEGQQMVFHHPFTCDDAAVTATFFNDVNGNGVQDADEPGFEGLDVRIDGVSAIRWSESNHFSFGGLDPSPEYLDFINGQLAHAVKTGETNPDGQVTFDGVGQYRTYRSGVDEAPTPMEYWLTANLPADCIVSPNTDMVTWGAGDDESPHPDRVADMLADPSFNAPDGIWENAGYTVSPDTGFLSIDVAWGDNVAVDVALECEEEEVPETTTTAPPETTTTTEAPVAPTTEAPVIPTTEAPVIPAGQSDGSVRIETGSPTDNPAAKAMTVVGGFILAGTAAVGLLMIRRRDLASR